MKCWLKFSLFALIGFLLFAAYSVLFYPLPSYHYESSDKGMADFEVPWKGRTLSIVEADFEQYKQQVGNPQLRLLRTSKRIWFSPNLWWDNFTNRRWKVPYTDPSPNPNNHWRQSEPSPGAGSK